MWNEKVQSWRPSTAGGPTWKFVAVTAVLSSLLVLLVDRHLNLPFVPRTTTTSSNQRLLAQPSCKPPLPNLFAQSPIQADDPALKRAFTTLSNSIRRAFESNDNIDALTFAVVSSNGPVFEAYHGPLKANESDVEKRGSVDAHSIFRIASGSKLFAALETFILREKGALRLDDSMDKFFPSFTYKDGGWADADNIILSNPAFLSSNQPITVRQLMSHMSGLMREYPRGDMHNWPYSLEGSGPPGINGRPFPTLEETIEGMKEYPLVLPTYSYPIYSNAGFGLLGQVALQANAALENANGVLNYPRTWTELAQRDIFLPLGMNGSSFLATSENSAHIAVASKNSDEVDVDFLDVMASSGGQMSSLSDYIKVMQTIIDPTRPESLLPPHVAREWLHPLYGWSDDTTEVGMLWEISKIHDSYGRPIRIFQKHGSLAASRSVFAVNQDMSYGIAMLMTGTSSAAASIVLDAFEIHLQPVLDRMLAQRATELYTGQWTATEPDAQSELIIRVSDGSLWVTRLLLRGSNVLRLTQGLEEEKANGVLSRDPVPIALWSTGRLHEFRMSFGSPDEYDNTVSYATCNQFWVTIDVGFSRGYPMDLVYFHDSDDGLVLHVPSVNVTLMRRGKFH